MNDPLMDPAIDDNSRFILLHLHIEAMQRNLFVFGCQSARLRFQSVTLRRRGALIRIRSAQLLDRRRMNDEWLDTGLRNGVASGVVSPDFLPHHVEGGDVPTVPAHEPHGGLYEDNGSCRSADRPLPVVHNQDRTALDPVLLRQPLGPDPQVA
jgi:hypothetical protein